MMAAQSKFQLGLLGKLVLAALAAVIFSATQIARANELRVTPREKLETIAESATDSPQQTGTGLRIHRNAASGTIRQLKGAIVQPATPALRSGESSSAARARAFLNQNKALLGLADTNSELVVAVETTGTLGKQHIRYQQRHRGLPVWPTHLSVHLSDLGDVESVGGAYVRTPVIDVVPTIDRPEAERRAIASVESESAHAERTELIVYAPPAGGAPRLAWRLELHGALAHQHWRAVIDAHTGETLSLHSTVCTAAVQGTGIDLWGIERDIDVWHDSADNTYYTLITTKPMFDPATGAGAIRVFDAENQVLDNNPNFSAFLVSSNSSTAGWMPDAVSAAFGLSSTYDYFLLNHQRDSLDGQGGTIDAVVRYGENYQNAFFRSDIQAMFFGEAENYAGAIDVVAHELTHGVTSTTSNLVYEFESGAINEAMSDIFGEAVERFTYGQNDWLLGSELSAAMRDMANPNNIVIQGLGPLPSRMSEFYDLPPSVDQGGVHINSSIINHAFYLLAEGSAGAIGMDQAAQVFYRANTVHLGPASQFIDARLACIQSADELFGEDSLQAEATAAAFDAVEIFDGNAQTPPETNEDDAMEDNDSMATAVAIAAGTHALQGLDEDYFILDAAEASDVEIEIAGSAGDLDLYVYDAAGNQLAASESPTSAEGVSGSIDAGQLILRIVPFQDQTSSYTLTITLTALDNEQPEPPVETDDAFEENDTMATAAAIDSGEYPLKGLDDDVFALDLDGESTVDVAITGPDGDLDLCLLDVSGNALACSESATSNESVEGTLPAGRYYVLVAPSEPEATSDYRLTLTVTPVLADTNPPPGETPPPPGDVVDGGACGTGAPLTALAMAVGVVGLGNSRKRRPLIRERGFNL